MSNRERITEKPKVREYLSAREFLNAVYNFRKEKAAHFSYSTWAAELGFKSRSYLRLVIVGKRNFTDQSLDVFIRGLKFTSAEANHFLNLVKFEQASEFAQRQTHFERVLKGYKKSSRQVHDYYAFFSSHFGPRLQVLLSLTDIRKTPEKLAELLGAPLTVVSDLLQNLESIGLAKKNSSEWQSTTNDFEVADKCGDIALKSFYQKSFEDAVKAMELPFEKRKFDSLLLPLTSEEYSELNREIQLVIEKLFSKFSASTGNGRELYQIIFSSIPVSQPIIREKTTESSRAPEAIKTSPSSSEENRL